MTGGAFYSAPMDELALPEDGHSVQWVGTPGVKGPKWARQPLLTVGMLGTQVVWSIEMGYASPFLLELGLSKSWMSLVFVAGPLSGLIVQPLIGAYADRSRSRYGRRRPFMLAGCGIAAIGMMLLGWSREVSGLFGLGNWGAIACAIFSIYLIDFSINAVMSTDRALIVDTLPPSAQEEGNAWAGRMCGLGAMAGFFVGNIELPTIVPFFFLGKNQLQILSFLTSALLIIAHTSTSWAVTERVLLRDDRPQSRSGIFSSLKAIFDNMLTLPPGIRTICFIQFFCSLGWYPVLFFTSVWVSEVYKHNNPQGDLTAKVWEANSVRAGSRAMFLQSIIALGMSIAAPFLVAHSGVRPEHGAPAGRYAALARGDDEDDDGASTPNSAVWKRTIEERSAGSFAERASAKLADVIKSVKSGSAWALPIRSLTLIKLWTYTQCVFVCCMLASWFTTTVNAAYVLIAITGFASALAQWAPFALLGELVLLDTSGDASEMRALAGAPASEVVFAHDTDTGVGTFSGVHSRSRSYETLDANGHPLTRLVIPGDKSTRPDESAEIEELDTTVILRHSDDRSATSFEALREQLQSPAEASAAASQPSTADKAGLILGIHNVFCVIPQFLITAISSVVFHIMEPGGASSAETAGTAAAAGAGVGSGGGVAAAIAGDAVVDAAAPAAVAASRAAVRLVARAAEAASSHGNPNTIGVVFRIGGVAAAIGVVLTYRLGRRWASGQGV